MSEKYFDEAAEEFRKKLNEEWKDDVAAVAMTGRNCAPKLPGESDAAYFERRRRAALDALTQPNADSVVVVRRGVAHIHIPDIRSRHPNDDWATPSGPHSDPYG